MRWPALVMVAAAVAVSLAACDFQGAWNEYCAYPGRCAEIDRRDAGTRQISQGTFGVPMEVHGQYLAGARPRLVPADAASFTVEDAGAGVLLLNVSVPHGAPVGDVRLELQFERPADLKSWDGFIRVTPIVVAEVNADDNTGDGTFDRPYASLSKASEQSGPGDTIRLAAGTYDSIFPSADTVCDTPGAGLKQGVTVTGEPGGASVIAGSAFAGTCAFYLSSGDQAVANLTIRGFPEGIRAAGGGTGAAGRASVSGVVIESCGQGVVAEPGSSLLLQDVVITRSAAAGLVLDGADVLFRRGVVSDAGEPGVNVIGQGATLVLEEAILASNGGGQNGSRDPLTGAGISVRSTSGAVFIDGGFINLSGATGITVGGLDNTVAIHGANIRSEHVGGIGLLVTGGSNASVYLANSRISSSNWGIKVEDFATFNGGLEDGGWGGNVLFNDQFQLNGGEIWDARPGGAGNPPMTFARTSVHGVTPEPGTVWTQGSLDAGWLGVRIDGTLNQVQFR